MPDDLYSLWLKVPPGVRPPDHYTLLGLPRFCDDVEKIESAAHKRLDALDRYALHPDLVKRDACQQMMNEVARARVVLIDPRKRQAYDLALAPAKAAMPPAVRQVEKTPIVPVPVPPPPAAPIEPAPAVKARGSKPDLSRFIAPIGAALVVAVIVVAVILHRKNPSRETAVVTEHQPGSAATSRAAVTPSNAAPSPIAPRVTSPTTAAALAMPTSVPSATEPFPVPSDAERKAAGRLVDEIFDDELAHAVTPDRKVSLARAMLAMTARTADDPPGRFMLLTRAAEMAIQGDDAITAVAAIGQLGQHFQMDALKFKARALLSIAGLSTPGRKNPQLAAQFSAVISEAMMADRYDVANDLCIAACSAAAEANDHVWSEKAQARSAWIGNCAALFQKLAADRATLKNNPSDADANYHVGSYRCFVKTDWLGGLPMLAIGSDLEAKTLATKELGKPDDTDKLLELADGWWLLSERLSDLEKPEIERHAALIYIRIQAKTDGQVRSHIQKRIQEFYIAEARLRRADRSGG